MGGSRRTLQLNHPEKCHQGLFLSIFKTHFRQQRLLKIKCPRMSRWLFSKSPICFKLCTWSFAKKEPSAFHSPDAGPAFAARRTRGGSHSPHLPAPRIPMRSPCLNKLSNVQIDINTTFATLQYCANLRVIWLQCKYYSSCMKGNKYWWIGCMSWALQKLGHLCSQSFVHPLAHWNYSMAWGDPEGKRYACFEVVVD